MALNQIPPFPADKMAALFAAHAEYVRLKEELLAPVLKTTSGKANTLDLQSAGQWLPFIEENPKWVTNKVNLSDFALKLAADALLERIEKEETKDQGFSKAMRDIISSDVRFYWTMTEDFYIDAADEDSVIKEKYKSLPSISSKRKSDGKIEKDFQKLEARRNKKNGVTTDVKV